MARIEGNAPAFQYLGHRGYTFPCVEAVITLITSPNPPDYITVVFKRFNPMEKEHTSVAFVAWYWLEVELTIIPDGFGTHQGTGGWGLSLCLALIQTSGIRLEEVVISENSFNRVCNGNPTAKDIKVLQTREYGSPLWPMYVRDQHEKGIDDGSIWEDVKFESKVKFDKLPKWMIGSDLYSMVKTFDENPTATLAASLVNLEDTIRKLSGLNNLYGAKLIGDAFAKGGPLRFERDDENEADGWASLYRGVFAAIRNPLNHKIIDMETREVAKYIILTDMLMQQLKKEQKEKGISPKKKFQMLEGD